MYTHLYMCTYLKLDSHMQVNMQHVTFLPPCTFMSEISEVDTAYFSGRGEPTGQDNGPVKT